MPTRAGWLLVAGGLLSVGAGRAFGALELYVLGAAAGALLVVALVWVRRPLPDLDVARRPLPLRPTVRSAARVELAVRARDRRPLPVVALVDAVEGTVGARATIGPVRDGDATVVGYRLPTHRRGRVRIGPLVVERTDPFGLARRRRTVAGELVLTVLPRIDALPARAHGGGRTDPQAGTSQRAYAMVAADDLATLRPYQVGDDLRRVHWPSSAHADDLVVRRDEARWQGHATVLVDCRRGALDPDGFEQAIAAAASLVHATSTEGDRIRLVTTAGLDTGMVDARRCEALLLEELAVLDQHDGDAAPPPEPARHGTESLVVLGGPDAPEVAGAAAGYRDRRPFSFADPTAATFPHRWAGSGR